MHFTSATYRTHHRQTNYDLNHEQAKASRKNMLELAHSEDMDNMAFHFDFPGLGRVEKGNNSLEMDVQERIGIFFQRKSTLPSNQPPLPQPEEGLPIY